MTYKPTLPPPYCIIELPTVGSTNDHAKQLAKNGYPTGTIVWAHEQTAGRGRQGNSWISEPGNLFMSLILRPQVWGAEVGQFSFLSAVALAHTIEKIAPDTVKIELKWPNDVLVNEKKAAGILIETESYGIQSVSWLVIGIGVNITRAPPEALSLRDAGITRYEAGQVLEMLVREIQALIGQWEREGFDPIREMWLKRAYKLGESITARLPEEVITGTFDGLDQTGALLMTLAGGTQRVISSGEVFMDA